MKISPATLRRLVLVTAVALTCAPLASAQDTQRNYRLDTAFNPVPDNDVNALVVQPDGKILIGGDFVQISGIVSPGIARLNPDGSFDPSFHSGLPSDGVETMALQADGKIVVGGRFGPDPLTSAGNIARLNADGSLDSGFNASTDGGDYDVLYVLAQANGKIILSGTFSTVNGATANGGVARLNPDGSVDAGYTATVGAFLGANTGVGPAVLLQPDGKMLLGTESSDSRRPGLARLNSDGTLDSSFLPGTKPREQLFTGGGLYNMALQPDGKIMLVGNFVQVAGAAHSKVARLNPDGSADTTFTATVSASSTTPDAFTVVNAAAIQPDGKIVVAGIFGEVNGVPATNLARLRADGTLDPSFIANTGNSAGGFTAVRALALQPDGKILVGGNFDAVNDALHGNVARLNADPTITIEALNGNISDADLQQGSFRLVRTGDGLGSLTVNFLIRGGALNGTDYTIKNVAAGARDGKKKLKAGKFSKPIHVTPINTGDGGGLLKGIKIKLAPGDGYIVGDPAVAKFKIVDQ